MRSTTAPVVSIPGELRADGAARLGRRPGCHCAGPCACRPDLPWPDERELAALTPGGAR